MNDTPASVDARVLRRQLRSARRALQGDERKSAESRIVSAISRHRAFQRAQRIASFHAFDGEPDLSMLCARFPERQYFAPVIGPRGMTFAAMDDQGQKKKNLFGIAEPLRPKFFPSLRLDLVLTPLVGFDENGARIGMGRGYYDRCFRFLLERQGWRRPRLLGVAFECQRVTRLNTNPWDVPLWGIATENGIRIF